MSDDVRCDCPDFAPAGMVSIYCPVHGAAELAKREAGITARIFEKWGPLLKRLAEGPEN